MNTVSNNAQKTSKFKFYNLLTPSEILQVFMGRTRTRGGLGRDAIQILQP